ncbi:MAG: hypothetical protein IIY38_01780 [Clostridia bacterium]|nr:hypothetical protein [Clostridia bacterium]
MTLALCVGCWLAAGAQSTFTEQLQQSKAGEGKVTVTQDKAIDQLVNTPTTTTAPTTAQDTSDLEQDANQNTLLYIALGVATVGVGAAGVEFYRDRGGRKDDGDDTEL